MTPEETKEKVKEFYRTMWNPLYENTEHPQFSYKEIIEFTSEFAQQLYTSDDSEEKNICDCPFPMPRPEGKECLRCRRLLI